MSDMSFLKGYLEQITNQMQIVQDDMAEMRKALADMAQFELKAEGLERRMGDVEKTIKRMTPIVDRWDRVYKGLVVVCKWASAISVVVGAAWLIQYFHLGD